MMRRRFLDEILVLAQVADSEIKALVCFLQEMLHIQEI